MAATILVLEDDAALRELLCEVLEDEGHHVVTATTLPGLLQQMPPTPDLLISDMLFDLKPLGLEAISAVRSTAQRSLPAILCTAATTYLERYQEQINRLGAVVLSKPFTIDGLLTAVNSALDPRPVCA
ncbi:MAG TPA: response regulator [Herpetosiphonaceae bacterium]|nr:response regulator [Herpetosiphonaceae bacterium]